MHWLCPQEGDFTGTLFRSGTHRAPAVPNNPPPSYVVATGTRGGRSFDPSQLEDDEEDESAFITAPPPDYNMVAVEAPPPPTPPR